MSNTKTSQEKINRHKRFATKGICYNVDQDGPLIEQAFSKAEANRLSFASYILRLISDDLKRTGHGEMALIDVPARTVGGDQSPTKTIKVINK